ncbi:hypothetical protein LLG07_04885 [bacterium]|nr:hypothetical protein [bacterium]
MIKIDLLNRDPKIRYNIHDIINEIKFTDNVKCPYCNRDLIIRKSENNLAIRMFCPDCLKSHYADFGINISYCDHSNTKIAKIQNDYRVYYQKLCLNCGKKYGNILNKNDVIEYVLPGNKIIKHEIAENEISDFHKNYFSFRDNFIKGKEKSDFEFKKEKYLKYLNSFDWKIKRINVLKRDNYLCQGCLKSKATEVHHLNYNHIYNEFYFELISLCKDCHEKYHELNTNIY